MKKQTAALCLLGALCLCGFNSGSGCGEVKDDENYNTKFIVSSLLPANADITYQDNNGIHDLHNMRLPWEVNVNMSKGDYYFLWANDILYTDLNFDLAVDPGNSFGMNISLFHGGEKIKEIECYHAYKDQNSCDENMQFHGII